MELFKAQVLMYEIGISQRIAHNLAKYKLGLSRAYTTVGFIRECRETLDELGLPQEQRERIMKRALDLVNQDLVAIENSKLLDLAGGSECTAYALLCGPVMQLQEMQQSKQKN